MGFMFENLEVYKRAMNLAKVERYQIPFPVPNGMIWSRPVPQCSRASRGNPRTMEQ
jgi:hypothetical protein